MGFLGGREGGPGVLECRRECRRGRFLFAGRRMVVGCGGLMPALMQARCLPGMRRLRARPALPLGC